MEGIVAFIIHIMPNVTGAGMTDLSYLAAQGQSPATPMPEEMLTVVFHDDSSCGCHSHCKLKDNHFIKLNDGITSVISYKIQSQNLKLKINNG